MKRGICLLLGLLLCLSLLSGCGARSGGQIAGSSSEQPPSAPHTLLGGSAAQGEASAGDNAAWAADPALAEHAREYGAPARRSDASGKVNMNVAYPSGDCAAMEGLISNWLDRAGELLPEGADAGTLNMDYSAYAPNSRVVSVVLAGALFSGHDTVPTPELATFCADRITGSSLVIEDMLAEGMYDTLVQRVAGAAGLESLSGLPEHWAVTDEGFRFFLPDGEDGGFRAVDLSFDALSDVLTLPRAPRIALTFDDGPSDNTTHIVDIFAENNAKCSFCVVGSRVAAYADAAKYIVDHGFEIGIHTWSHTKLTNLSSDEIRREISSTQEAIQQYTSGSAQFLRPPYGSANESVSAICSELGLYIACWNIDTEDWSVLDAQAVADAILEQAKDGSIILCHDLYDTTAEAMEIAVPQLVAQGYELVTVTDLLSASYGEVTPGRLYYDHTEYKY